MVAVTSSICSRIEPVVRVTASAARADSSASWRTSSATTAKPRPCSPARAASIAAFNASRLVCDEMRLMRSTKSSIDTLSSPSWLICFDVVCTTSRTLRSTLPAAATSPRCRSATARISSPSFAARSAASAMSPVAVRRASRPVPMEVRAARCWSAPPEISTIAVDTSLEEEAREHEGDDEDPELALPIARVRGQTLRSLRRLLGLTPGEIAHQPGQLRRLRSHRRRPRHRFRIAPQVPERVCDRVLGLDRRVELLHAVHRETILDGEAAQGIQPPLMLKSILGGRLELSSRLVAGRPQVLLGGPDLFQHARDETASLLGRYPQPVELLLDRVPDLSQGGGARDRRDDETGQEQGQPDADTRADRVESTPHYGAASVTSRPFRTTPMTAVLPAASPLPSNAIAPVTPSNAACPRPTRAR